jgi:hypothetical protein
MAQMRANRETVLVAASIAWCAVLACGLLYLILIAAGRGRALPDLLAFGNCHRLRISTAAALSLLTGPSHSRLWRQGGPGYRAQGIERLAVA